MVDRVRVQARRACARGMAPLLLAWLAGCSGGSPLDAPIAWWHQLEGGPIADQRPPPPGASDPFPNLGQIPKRPTPTDPNTRQNIADALSADRTLAERDAAAGADRPAGPAQAARARQSRSGRRRCRDARTRPAASPPRSMPRRRRPPRRRLPPRGRPRRPPQVRPRRQPGASRVLLRPGAGARGGGRSGAIRAAAGIRRPSPGRARSARARDSRPSPRRFPW